MTGCNHPASDRCSICAPVLSPPSRSDRMLTALESIAASLEKIGNPVRMVDLNGVVHTLEDSLQLAGYRIVKEDRPLPPWTFPHEWHVHAERVVTGGVRESGPA